MEGLVEGSIVDETNTSDLGGSTNAAASHFLSAVKILLSNSIEEIDISISHAIHCCYNMKSNSLHVFYRLDGVKIRTLKRHVNWWITINSIW